MSTTEAQRKLEDKTIHLTVYISFFRSLVMRASYVAQDRPDISELSSVWLEECINQLRATIKISSV